MNRCPVADVADTARGDWRCRLAQAVLMGSVTPRSAMPASSLRWIGPVAVLSAAAVAMASDDEGLPPSRVPTTGMYVAALLSVPVVEDARARPRACSLATLSAGQACLFDPLPAGDRTLEDNLRVADRAGARVCDELTRALPSGDAAAAARGYCLERWDNLTRTWVTSGPAFLDENCRFSAAYAAGYAALADALDDVRTMAPSFAGCCACLTSARCSSSFATCADAVSLGRSPVDGLCSLSSSCAERCLVAGLLAPAGGAL